jgi:peptidyl-prolyl cis-trans isomerase B (cyclophilin B)
MIQAGSPTNDGRGGESIWGEPFEDEFTARLHNYRGALSMANSGPNTNGSQFFIVQKGPVEEAMLRDLQEISEFEGPMYQDFRTLEIVSGAQRFTQKAVDIYGTIGGTPWLDGGFPSPAGRGGGHTVFGQVFEGMDIVDAIASVATDQNDKPGEPVVITNIEITTF